MNRKHRRAKASMAQKRRSQNRQGISHENLSWPAFEKLTNQLEDDFGQVLSNDHKKALAALMISMTEMAQGRLSGRNAFGLPTGTGKTLSIVAWLSTLIELGHSNISVAVSASKVEALCELKRDLIKAGIPGDTIALIHSYKHDLSKVHPDGTLHDGYASEPCDNADRQIVLVTHQRIRNSSSLETFHKHNGKIRNLLIYDESLLASDSTGIALNDLKGALGWYTGKYGDQDNSAQLVGFVSSCVETITAQLEKLEPSIERVIRMPPLSEKTRNDLIRLAGRYGVMEPVRTLLDISRHPVRIVSTGQGGLVWYQIAIPKEIKNVVILDASHPIRELSRLDPTINDAEETIDLIKSLGKPLAAIKKFDDVTIKQMFVGGGRSTMANDFTGDRKRAKEVARLIASLPDNESVLVFTYKKRMNESINYKAVILSELEKLKVDVDASLPSGRKRINILTWGMETSLNEYNHCSHVILAGVLQRNPVDLVACYIGQKDALHTPLSDSTATDLQLSESVHLIYQALSRGSCRNIHDGQARPMTGYIMHRDDRVQHELSKVMPGVCWENWISKLSNTPLGKVKSQATEIATFLKTTDQPRISSRAVKKALESEVDSQSWSRAFVRAVTNLPDWKCEGRSAVRLTT